MLSHTPSRLILVWLLFSLPLVLWDIGYVMLRPHSMVGGALHSPLWKPYALYAEVDQVYGEKALDEHNGWTAAQSLMNIIETAGYVVYFYGILRHGQQPRALAQGASAGWKVLSEPRVVQGPRAGRLVLVAYTTACLTFSKTVIYWLLEACSGFDNIGHNDLRRLVLVWIIPNGLWLVFPLYMVYLFGEELLKELSFPAADIQKRE